MFERVVNKTGIQLTKAAYQAVRISNAQGQRLAIQLAQANNDNNSADTIGLVVETINDNQEGYIYTVGEIDDINTTGSLQGETWVDGDVLYLSPTTAGRITNVKPVAPQHLVLIGYVVYSHANHGKIYVKTMNGWELGELHDVDTTGATNGQVLKYNGTIWTPSSDLDTGITSLNGLTALTQTFATGSSGTDFNISSSTSTHTFNLPTASATNRGLLSTSDWSTFNAKQDALTLTTTGTSGAATLVGSTLNIPQYSGTNIYNSDGTLTGNRIVSLSTYNLRFTTPNTGIVFRELAGAPSYFAIYGSNVATPSSGNYSFITNATGTETQINGVNNSYLNTSTNQGINVASHGIRFASDVVYFSDNSKDFGRSSAGTNRARYIYAGTGILVNTTTLAGYSLDVNGTGRFTGALNFTGGTGVAGSITYGGTYGLLLWGNTGSASDLTLTDRGGGLRVQIVNGGNILQTATLFNGNIGIETTSGNSRITKSATYGMQFWGNNSATNYSIQMYGDAGSNGLSIGNNGNVVVGGLNATNNASAVLQAESTTKGFLPPRMTTTQKNAIATPAAGLIVFDTTLAKLWVYRDWETDRKSTRLNSSHRL